MFGQDQSLIECFVHITYVKNKVNNSPNNPYPYFRGYSWVSQTRRKRQGRPCQPNDERRRSNFG